MDSTITTPTRIYTYKNGQTGQLINSLSDTSQWAGFSALGYSDDPNYKTATGGYTLDTPYYEGGGQVVQPTTTTTASTGTAYPAGTKVYHQDGSTSIADGTTKYDTNYWSLVPPAYTSSTSTSNYSSGSTTGTTGSTTGATSGLNTYQYVTTNGSMATVQASDPTAAMKLATNIDPHSGVQLISVGTMPSAGAPTSASNVTSSGGTVTSPYSSPSFGNISGATAGTTAMSTLLDTLIQQSKDYQAQATTLQNQQNQTNQNFLSKLMSSPSPSDVRSQAYAQTGINPTNYFAEEKATIAEIGALTQEYNAVKAAMQSQIAATGDKLGSMNFINNQIAQIERNAAPQLNMLSANINAKAAVLQASQGLFQEAQNFVNQAVQDATADFKYNLDLFQTFYQINQDQITRLDTKYQNAFNSALTLAQNQYNQALDDRNAVGELMLANPKAGILITDSVATAYQKAGLNPTADFQIVESGGGIYRIDKTTGQMTTLKAPTATSSGAKLTDAERAASQYSYYSSAFTAGQTINGGVPTVDANGYATPVAWRAAIGDTSLSRADFIKRFGYLLYTTKNSDGNIIVDPSYGLTPQEMKLITG